MKTMLQYTFILILLSLLFLRPGCKHSDIVKKDIGIKLSNSSSSGTKSNVTGNTLLNKTDISKISSSTNTIKIGEIIFVSNSHACHCTLEKCNYIEEQLKSIILENKDYQNTIEINEIDYGKDPDKVEKLFKEYKLWFIPSVILKDKTGKIYYKSSYDFDEITFRDNIKTMISGSSVEQEK